MKHRLLCIFFLFSVTIFAQNAIAELKFEEAETAFNNANYDLTLQKVDEFEKELGGITDKSLYLRIVSQNKLFNPSIFYTDNKQFTLYNSLVDNTNKYLKATVKNGLDDKFKDIYGISENLKKLNFTNDKAIWQKEKQRITNEEQLKFEEAKQLELLYKEIAPKIDAWEWREYVKVGANFKELKKKFPGNYEKLWKDKVKVNSKLFNTYTILNGMYGEPNVFDGLLANESGTITNYSIFLGKFTDEQQMQEFVNKELSKLKEIFGEKSIKKSIEIAPLKRTPEFSSIEQVFEMGKWPFYDQKEYFTIESSLAGSSIILIVEKMVWGFYIVRGQKNLVQ